MRAIVIFIALSIATLSVACADSDGPPIVTTAPRDMAADPAEVATADGGGAEVMLDAGSPSSEISTTVEGASVAQTGTAFIGAKTSNGAPYTLIILSSHAQACSFAQSHAASPEVFANESFLFIQISGAVAPGTYPAAVTEDASTPSAGISFNVLDDMCSEPNLDAAPIGTVTVTGVTSTSVTGNFDITFETGEHVVMSFSADACDVSKATGAVPSTCSQ